MTTDTTLARRLGESLRRMSIPEPNSGCWLWTGYCNKDGYGRITIDATTRYAHRVSWFLQNGEIPNGAFVCHRCDTPACVNPDHLFLGTHQDNMDDKVAKGRASGQFGECNPRARFTTADVLAILKDSRPQIEIAASYGASLNAINHIKSGRRWAHLNLGAAVGQEGKQ